MLQNETACNESDGYWLPLIEYSVKSGVSLSTIRRKIKSNSIQFRLEKGKYLILFQGNVPKEQAPERKMTPAPAPAPIVTPSPVAELAPEEEEDSWSQRMITDAFEHALSEKDERIRLLERQNQELAQHLNELRLLVKVLEEKYEVRY